MKILSNKKYELLMQKLTDLKLDLQECEDDNRTYQIQVDYLSKKNHELGNNGDKLGSDLNDLKNEVRRLKTLLTKNNINYKKEDESNVKSSK